MLKFSSVAISLIIACAACTAPQTQESQSVYPQVWKSTLSQDHPLVGKIWSPEQAAFVTEETLLQSVVESDLVFLGEKHDNADHHLLQAWLTDKFAASGRRPAVVFEMIGEERQDVIDSHRAKYPKDASGLGAALSWEKSGWPDWSQYQPIADTALRHDAPLIAGNLPRGQVRNVGRKGLSALPAARQQRLHLDETMQADYGNTMLEIVTKGHCGLMPRSALGPMVTVQRVKDAVLADNMIQAYARAETDSAILIAGGGHARRDIGAPQTAARLAPNAGIITVVFIEVDDSSTDPADYAGNFSAETLPFDFVWFTPRANNRDYCAELKQRFSGHKKP